MKNIVFLFFLFGCRFTSSQVDSIYEFESFLSLVSNNKLPCNTKTIEDERTMVIPKSFIIRYLLQNDSSRLIYDYQYFDNDKQKNMVEKATYNYSAICKGDYGNIKVLVYSRYWDFTNQYIIATFIKSQLIDQLVFGYSEGDTEIIKYTEGEIVKDYTLKTKAYILNSEFSSQRRKENPDFPRSIITLSEYRIDSISGKINLIKSEKKYSKCSPEEFSYKNNKCEFLNK